MLETVLRHIYCLRNKHNLLISCYIYSIQKLNRSTKTCRISMKYTIGRLENILTVSYVLEII